MRRMPTDKEIDVIKKIESGEITPGDTKLYQHNLYWSTDLLDDKPHGQIHMIVINKDATQIGYTALYNYILDNFGTTVSGDGGGLPVVSGWFATDSGVVKYAMHLRINGNTGTTTSGDLLVWACPAGLGDHFRDITKDVDDQGKRRWKCYDKVIEL